MTPERKIDVLRTALLILLFGVAGLAGLDRAIGDPAEPSGPGAPYAGVGKGVDFWGETDILLV